MIVYRFFRTVMRNRCGAATVEYAFILALIVLAMFAALQGLAGETVGLWSDIDSKTTAATNPS